MRPLQPMTFLVVAALAVCLIAGIWFLVRAARLRRAAAHVCARCKASNRPDAKFCARCGAALGRGPTNQHKDTADV